MASVDFGLIFFIAAFVLVPGLIVYILLWNWMKPRQRLARRFGIDLGVPAEEVRCGDEFEALVTISTTRGLRDVQAGVVCTERYDEEDTDAEGHTTRTTRNAVAHQAWLSVESIPGTQSIRLVIPPEAPFSHEGSRLSFKWEVAARGRRRLRLDAEARHGLWVLP